MVLDVTTQLKLKFLWLYYKGSSTWYYLKEDATWYWGSQPLHVIEWINKWHNRDRDLI